ncbi:MAG: hypothetical protein ACRDSP_23940 [Pseudonocardiaceae bacterium]
MSAAATGEAHAAARDGGRGDREGRIRALAVLGVVVVLLGMAVGWLWWLDQRNSAAEAARRAAPRAAAEEVVPVLSYDYRSIGQDLRRARAVLTGSYRDEFTAEMNKVTAPAARESHVSTHASVIGSSVVRADPEEVVVLLFVNQSTRSSKSPSVQLSAHRIQLTMTLVDGHWLVSKLERV